MKILIIAYYFPPFGGGAVSRVHSFVKYLPDSGIFPVVLTANQKNYEDFYFDDTLIKQYSPEVKVHRANMLFGLFVKKNKKSFVSSKQLKNPEVGFSRLFKKFIKSLFFPDEQILWVPDALRIGIKILRSTEIDAILSTSPPFSAHLVGGLLSKRFKIPLFLDYRDLWSSNPFYYSGSSKNSISLKLEKWILKISKCVFVTNDFARDQLMSIFNLRQEKINVIENGFDFETIQAINLERKKFHQDKFRIRYIGSITPNRTPLYFLRAVSKFHTHFPQVVLEISFIGYFAPNHINIVDDLKLSEHVHFIPSVAKAEADQLMVDSELLLIFQKQKEGGGTAIPGKLYEYLASGVPVLVMDEGNGATSTFMLDNQFGFVCEYSDDDKIFEILQSIIFNYQIVSENSSLIRTKAQKYNRQTQTSHLANYILEVAGKTDG